MSGTSDKTTAAATIAPGNNRGALYGATASGSTRFKCDSGSPASVARISFAILSVLTGTTVALGWRAAAQRRFQVHRRWMSRCFVLLCSAVVLRLVVGLATVVGVQSMWFDPVVSWASWLVPLAALELVGLLKSRAGRSRAPQSVRPPVAAT
ncbi:MAG: DUF2306 domain-containing protein [Planctomycetales bacterium]|nr:DUF2306 domain-containing protein [Planctomycetales bacterium]